MQFITFDNKEESSLIKDVLLYPLKINQDESGGILVETLRKDWKDIYGENREFSMQYFSVTESGVARDEKVWHLHPNYQEDRFLVARGEIVVAVADKRDGSPTKDLLNLFHMKAYENPYIILIPKNTLHGFLVVSNKEAVLLNFPTGLYNPDEEGRIPYEKAQVKTEDGNLFSWDLVRKQFPL
ncbi:MAG: dTDP-4-dehydrorhamnose 3,5-epimerase [Candidatus Levybacteria bacterium CG10_big_fil_rev_8_21_14_0_10_35_13]|nr:MAG: dTDP-4-dehydrorhamnose 3,5-epimerase [Candidatus Levybacteria bacterium CG10_big_fil_rev_8_21_14_0_10_35_13]